MKKNELIKNQDKIYRVLDVSEQEVLVIDCMKLTMPQWIEATSIPDAETITDDIMMLIIGAILGGLVELLLFKLFGIGG